MANENKVQFNLHNVHIAPIINYDSEDGVPNYETPIPVPGAVSLTLGASGTSNPFYADGIVYFMATQNTGYNGDLTMARFPDAIREALWGYFTTGNGKLLTEVADIPSVEFALLFDIDGDVDHEHFVLYRCTATKPALNANTNTDSKNPDTQVSTISAMPILGVVMARTTSATPSTVKANWFDDVDREPLTAERSQAV